MDRNRKKHEGKTKNKTKHKPWKTKEYNTKEKNQEDLNLGRQTFKWSLDVALTFDLKTVWLLLTPYEFPG